MRVLIDENTAVQLLNPLRSVLPGHRIDHITEVKWQGKKDRPVLADAKRARYDVFLTLDHSQLSDPGECDAIRKSGLHHVTYSQRQQGTIGLGLALGAVIAAMPLVEPHPPVRHDRPVRQPAELLAALTLGTLAHMTYPNGFLPVLAGMRSSADYFSAVACDPTIPADWLTMICSSCLPIREGSWFSSRAIFSLSVAALAVRLACHF